MALHAHGIAEVLTDYEMKIYFNPYYYRDLIEQLEADKEDLYYKSCSWTDYDAVYGISRRSISVENLGEKLLSLDGHIKQLERKYRKRRQILSKSTKALHRADVKLLDRYFRQQMAGYTIEAPALDYLKVELYEMEQVSRSEREKDRWRKENQKTLRKAETLKNQKTVVGGGKL